MEASCAGWSVTAVLCLPLTTRPHSPFLYNVPSSSACALQRFIVHARGEGGAVGPAVHQHGFVHWLSTSALLCTWAQYISTTLYIGSVHQLSAASYGGRTGEVGAREFGSGLQLATIFPRQQRAIQA